MKKVTGISNTGFTMVTSFELESSAESTILGKLAITCAEPAPLFNRTFSLTFSIGAGVEAGVLIAGVSFDVGASGTVNLVVPGSRLTSAKDFFLGKVTYPSGPAKSPDIEKWVDNSLSNLENKNKVDFEVRLEVSDRAGHSLDLGDKMGFSSKEATGDEEIEIRAFHP